MRKLPAFLILLTLSLLACRGRESSRLAIAAPQQALFADGSTTIELPIAANDGRRIDVDKLEVKIDGGRGHGSARLLEKPARIIYRVGVLPGATRLTLLRKGRLLATIILHTQAVTSDRMGDGLPDWMRLEQAQDRVNFRRWFTLLAEHEAREGAEANPEIADCAGLLRYCLRETLRRHDSAWARERNFTGEPLPDDIAKYEYPYTPLGAAMLRVRAGSFVADDMRNGAFAEFADARTLLEHNVYRVGGDVAIAKPGDLFFYRQLGSASYHSMIYVGAGRAGTGRWVVYHTGPDHAWKGEMRRVALEDLLRHPDARWRPIAGNPNFLGVFRWKLLREAD